MTLNAKDPNSPLRKSRYSEPRGKEEIGTLYGGELFWRDHQPWLLERGYLLRPHYHQNWKPSWHGTDKSFMDCEDGVCGLKFMDATRIADGQIVALKAITRSRDPEEGIIGRYFSTEPHASDVRNHCVPIYEELQSPLDPDKYLIVMPLLLNFFNPRFDTIGEAVEFLRQIFQGLQFMHEQRVAHRYLSI